MDIRSVRLECKGEEVTAQGPSLLKWKVLKKRREVGRGQVGRRRRREKEEVIMKLWSHHMEVVHQD